MSTTPPIAQRRSGTAKVVNRLRRPHFSDRVEAWINAQVFDAQDWREAAKQAKIKIAVARQLLGLPVVKTAMQERARQVRTTEATRNPVLAARIRDMGFEDGASAADRRNALDAMKYLETPEHAPASSGFGIVFAPGLVIDCSAFARDLAEMGGNGSPPTLIDAAPIREDDEP